MSRIEKGIQGSAYFSPRRKYRYWLKRVWGANFNNLLPIVGLNPSDADESEDDMTIKKCIQFARQRKKDGLVMLNLFALVSTDPKGLFACEGPIGPENEEILDRFLLPAAEVLVCWGGSHILKGRDIAVLKRIRNPICLGMTKSGFPRHPSRLSYKTEFTEYAIS